MGLVKTVIQPPFDIDAQRFIYATGITNFTQKRAINYLVKGLKQNNLWSKMAAVYPMVGGTAWTCKFNLVNPRDSDIAYRLTYTASPTFTIQGIGWNGTNQFANTNLIPSANTLIGQNDTHMSYYSRTSAGAGLDMGVNDLTNGFRCYMAITGGAFSINTTSSADTFTNANLLGLFVASRTASNLTTAYMNGANVFSTVTASNGKPILAIFLGCRNQQGTASNFVTHQCAFASVGTGLSAADAFNFYAVVQQFQTILGRQV